MATHLKRKGSPWWWIQTKDPKTGKWKRSDTRWRHDDPKPKFQVVALCHELSAKEGRITATFKREELWESWVMDYFTAIYPNSFTLTRSKLAWKYLSIFLKTHNITCPRMLTREDIYTYQAWRKSDAALRKRRNPHNSIVLEIGTLQVLMKEARRRGFCDQNPCRDLGIRRIPPKPKPELTDEDINNIRAAIERHRLKPGTDPEVSDFLANSFEIALHQGFRISETCIEVFKDVHLQNQTVPVHPQWGQ